jgi:hypothetical protein
MSASTAATSLFFIGKILPKSNGEKGLAKFTKGIVFLNE